MRDAPSQARMMDPTNAQSGKPNYVDSTVETASNTFYPNRGEDSPAYISSDPRHIEYR